MNKRKKYFRKQKTIGVVITILSVLTALLLEDGGVMWFTGLPIGLWLIFSKDMLITDDYFFEVMEQEEEEL